MKEYLLLRKNVKTGPYDLKDLENLNLQSSDLIWIEGKSSGWSYPSELTELSTFIKEDIVSSAITVRLPRKSMYSEKSYESVNKGVKILKVQVREQMPEQASVLQEVEGYVPDNKVEMFVLAVGAISIIAVIYLLVTSTY